MRQLIQAAIKWFNFHPKFHSIWKHNLRKVSYILITEAISEFDISSNHHESKTVTIGQIVPPNNSILCQILFGFYLATENINFFTHWIMEIMFGVFRIDTSSRNCCLFIHCIVLNSCLLITSLQQVSQIIDLSVLGSKYYSSY